MVAYSSSLFLAIVIITFGMFPLIDGVGLDGVGLDGVELIYRDTPLYNASASRLNNALHQSLNRAKYFQSVLCQTSSPQGKVIPDSTLALYLMKIFIGSPPMEFLAIADTGSDFIWIPCQTGPDCRRKSTGTPIFNQYHSSTYNAYSCNSSACLSHPDLGTSCDRSTNICKYRGGYGGGQVSRGELATDMLALGSIVHQGPKVFHTSTIIGCEQEGNASSLAGGHGLVGLGRGPLSLISQWDSSIGGKFSYCLSPLYDNSPKSSKINFGDKAIVSGYGVVSTPILNSYPETWYALQLDGLTIGGTRLDFLDSESANVLPEVGNIIIDSGSLLTYFPTTFYNRVESVVRSVVKFKPLQSTEQEYLSLCYNSSDVLMKDMPTMIAHFRGADVVLNPLNTFIPDTHAICLGIAARDDVCAFGCLAPQNFLIGYNLDTNMLSFKPTQCSKQ